MSSYQTLSRFYDLEYNGKVDDIPFYVNLAKQTGPPVLECGCGTGRILIPIASNGIQIVGIDLSGEMLNIAMTKIQRKKLQGCVQLIKDDMTRIRSEAVKTKQFNLIIITFNSFLCLVPNDIEDKQGLTPQDLQERALENLHDVLKDEGIIAIDVFNPDFRNFPPHVLKHNFTRGDQNTGKTISSFSALSFELDKQIFHLDFFFEELSLDGNVRKWHTRLTRTFIYKDQLIEMITKNGFNLLKLYGDFQRGCFTNESPQIIVVAKKC